MGDSCNLGTTISVYKYLIHLSGAQGSTSTDKMSVIYVRYLVFEHITYSAAFLSSAGFGREGLAAPGPWPRYFMHEVALWSSLRMWTSI